MKRTFLKDVGLPSLLAIGFIGLDLILDALTGARDEFVSPHLILAAVVLLISYTLLRRATGARARAEAVLLQARDELELRVGERTAEIERVNERLEAEIAVRVRAEAEANHLSSFPRLNPNPVLEVDASGSVVYRNPATVRTIERLGVEDASAFLPAGLGAILQELEAKQESTFQREVQVGPATYLATVQVLPAFGVARVYAYEITKRKQIEETLRQSEERFRLVLKNAPVTVAAQDLDLRFIWAYNQRTLIPDSVLGKTDTDLFPPDTAARLADLKRRVLETGSEVRDQMWVESGGHRLYLDVYLEPIRSESGAIAGVGIATVDLTERKLAERALRIERDRAESYLNIADVMIVALDAEQRVTLINNRGCKVLGRPETEIIGANWFDAFVPIRVRNKFKASFTQALAGEVQNYEHFENLVLTHDGEERLISWHNVALKDEAGRIIGTLSSGEDITDRKRVEEALRGSEEKFAGVFYFSPDAIGIARISDGAILDVNDAFTELLGYSRMEVIGKPWQELTLLPKMEAIEKVEEQLRTRGVVSDLELELAARSGDVVTLLASLIPAEISGEPCMLAIAHDITKRKRSEDALRRVQTELARGLQERTALEERQRLARELHDSVSQALYGVSLGVNTALTVFDTDRAKVLDALRYSLSLAHAGLVEMRALIFELRPESLEMEGLVTALTKQSEVLRARHGIEVELSLGCEPDVPLLLKEALYRIAREALQNAIKHSRSTRLDVLLTCEADGLRLEVCDNGVGFDPQADYPGHLGLHSMRERALGFGGKLEITSTPNCGTQVRVFVPLTGSVQSDLAVAITGSG